MCDGGQNFIFHHGVGGQKLKFGIDGGGQKKLAKFVKIPPNPQLINNDCFLTSFKNTCTHIK